MYLPFSDEKEKRLPNVLSFDESRLEFCIPSRTFALK